MKFYECDVAAVLTNQYFTNSAVALAGKTDVLLWDRAVPRRAPQCKKPRLLNLAGLLGMGWQCLALLFSLLSTEGLKSLQNFPGLADGIFCILLFLGSAFSFWKKEVFFFSSFHSTAGTFCPLPGFISSTASEEFSCFRYCSFFSAFFAHES